LGLGLGAIFAALAALGLGHRPVGEGSGAVPPPGRTIVVLPTYDEAGSIREVIARALASAPQVEVLVVDDASPDGTGAIADEIAAAEPRVRAIHRSGKEGLGTAYLTGFRDALARGSDAVVEMDSDLSHDPADIARLIEASRTADLVIGSRYVPGGKTRNWARRREWLSRGGNAYARGLLRFPVRDATSGFRLYRRPVLEELPLDEVASEGYAFQIEMAWRAWAAGFVVREIPITFTERRQGASKMSGAIVREAARSVARWAFRRAQRPRAPHPRSVGSA
jgi:dolichol-phosphate mannosyltransferase